MITIDGYPLDVVETIQHDLESEVTEHPVEEGDDVSDNVRNKPRELTFTNAVVSDTPIGAIAQDPTRSPTSGRALPSQDAFTRLEKIWESRDTVTVVTRRKKYDRMILDKLTVPQDHKDGGALVFTAHFKQIRIVQNRRVTVAVPNLGGKQTLGTKTSALWSKKLGIKNVIFVITFGHNPDGSVDQRVVAAATKSLGPPVLVDQFGAHYEVVGGQRPDGYIRDGKYFPVNATGQDVVKRDQFGNPLDNRDRFGNAIDPEGTTFNGRPVNYNYADRTWRDPNDNSIVKTVPPDQNVWEGITQGGKTYHNVPVPGHWSPS